MTPIIAKEGIDALQGKACCTTACKSQDEQHCREQ
jgi:hypothetical protein